MSESVSHCHGQVASASSASLRSSGMKQTARPAGLTETMATVGQSSSSCGGWHCRGSGTACLRPMRPRGCDRGRRPRGRESRLPGALDLALGEALQQTLAFVTEREAHPGDLARHFAGQPCERTAGVHVARYSGHWRHGLERCQDLRVDDVSSVDDVDDAGEVLEDRGVEIAVVVADHADADRGGRPGGAVFCRQGWAIARRRRRTTPVTPWRPQQRASGSVTRSLVGRWATQPKWPPAHEPRFGAGRRVRSVAGRSAPPQGKRRFSRAAPRRLRGTGAAPLTLLLWGHAAA